jgi:hypothetical protein
LDKGLEAKKAEKMAQAKVNRDVRGGAASPRIDKEGNPVFKKDGTQRMDYQGGQHALHNQDRWAGGVDMVGTKKPDGSIVLSDKDFGWGDVNSGIGRQWEQGGRVESMDIEACEAQRNGLGQEKMNVELRACGKKEAKKNGCK